jgi:hypothetical protein
MTSAASLVPYPSALAPYRPDPGREALAETRDRIRRFALDEGEDGVQRQNRARANDNEETPAKVVLLRPDPSADGGNARRSAGLYARANAAFLTQHLAQEVVPSGLHLEPLRAAARAYGPAPSRERLVDVTA